MKEDILINVTPQETRIAVVSEGSTQELHIERSQTRGLAGNVYLGRVVRVLPGMQSAFIDIGLERAAFLHIDDILEAHQNDSSAGKPVPIERMLTDGQSLMVRVIKDPLGTKGARLSTQISIAGRLLVYLPQEKHIGISQRIQDEKERELLKNRVQQFLTDEEKGGFIIRTMAEDASEDDLKTDAVFLQKIWRSLKDKAYLASAPTLLYQDLTLPERILRDFVHENTARIRVDSHEEFLKLREFAATYTPDILERLSFYEGDRPLFDLYNVEEEIGLALSRRVNLKSGGYLIIDQTEAMTTIDVNTGGFVNGRTFDDTIFKTNLEAAHAIARQLRLRNLGGIIILDFIDMENAEHRRAVMDELRKTLAKDRTKVSLSDFSALGLVEMTRKRTRESLAHILCEPCPVCHGQGQVKTAQTVCYEIMRDILREARQFSPKEFRILASQIVIDLFLEEESQHLASLGDLIGKPISLQVESAYTQTQYDVILM
ncbi:ribonuclease G [Oxalobacter paraformigenes]|uniref:Ribonuclease G n=1 Tax=Oxalobacter paraformigenes TaxID=556268 RepID=C3X1B1_9BURK|nr:ribonuclease G [Oxalobacter paraformigenes]EEO26997.1 rne/Rng family ribonuclease [Oxalobacter paraformigenes]